MQTVLEQGSIDKPLTFDVGLIQLSFIPVCSLNTCNISVKLCRGFALQCFLKIYIATESESEEVTGAAGKKLKLEVSVICCHSNNYVIITSPLIPSGSFRGPVTRNISIIIATSPIIISNYIYCLCKHLCVNLMFPSL